MSRGRERRASAPSRNAGGDKRPRSTGGADARPETSGAQSTGGATARPKTGGSKTGGSPTKEELIWAGVRQVRLFQIASDKMDDAFCARAGVNHTDARCIDLLDVHGAMTAGELAAEASLSPGAVTAVLDRLERMDLVTRTRDERDRRRVLIEITDKARQLAFEVYGPVAQYARPYLDELTLEELEIIMRYLEVATEVNERRANELREQR